MSDTLRTAVILSVNRALLGEVFPELVAVACEIANEWKFRLVFVVDSKLVDFKSEELSCIETEVIADFSSDFEISHEVIRSRKVSLPTSDAFWIFLRKDVEQAEGQYGRDMAGEERSK